MPEHLIRLRGAWDRLKPGVAPETPDRVTLPIVWPEDATGRIELIRRFQSPSVDPGRETIFLRMEAVGGLASVRWNDREIVSSPSLGAVEVELGAPMPRRNTLSLAVDLNAVPHGEPWGQIALVIVDRGSPDGRRSPAGD